MSLRACRFFVCFVLAVTACSVSVAVARQQRTPEEYAKFLEGAERVQRMQVPHVVSVLELKPGMRVADIGSGSGLFTRPIARAVASGGVAYAVDIDSELLKIVARSAGAEQIGNIRTVLAAPDDPKLPEPVDLIFICDTLHHISNAGTYLQGLRRYLKPGGRLAIIDFSGRWPDGHESMRYSAAQLHGWMGAAGFRQAGSFDWLDNSFFLVFH